MNCLWNKIEQILCKKPKYLKGDFFWKMRRLGSQFTFSQKDIFVEVCRRENGYLNKSIICKTDDNNKYHVQVTLNYTKSVTDIECNSQQEFTTLLNDLVNYNYEPCQGVSFEQVMFNPNPVSVRDQLQNLLLEEQWDTGNLIVRSRKCKMYGILNEAEDGTFVCDSCSPLMGDPLSIKIEQFEAEEEDLKGQEDCKENEKEKFLTPDEEESDPTWGADVKEHHQVMVEPDLKKSYTRCLECNLVQKNMCNLKRHFVRKHKWDKQKELEGSIKCFRCEGLVLPSMPEYISHLLEQHKISRDEFPTHCGVCSNVFFFPSHLHIHQKDEHGIPIPAEQKVDRKKKYKPTKVEEPPEKKLKRKEICDALEEVVGVKSLKIMPMSLECDLTFHHSKGLQNHFKKVHKWDEKNPYESSIECLKCDKLVLKNINEFEDGEAGNANGTNDDVAAVGAKKVRKNIPWRKEEAAVAQEIVKAEGCWRIDTKKSTFEGRKIYYICKLGAECPAKICILEPNTGAADLLFRSDDGHENHNKVAKGIAPETQECITELYRVGVTKPKAIFRALREKNVAMMPTETQLKNFLVSVRENVRGPATITFGELQDWAAEKHGKHMGRHEREKAQCPLCSKGFVHKGNLRLHFKDHHDIIIPKGEDWNIEDYARRESVFTNTT